MMKILTILFLATCFSIDVKAQVAAVNQDTSCSFLKNLKFKNGVDTIVIKASYVALIQLAPFTTYEESFLKKRKINRHKIVCELEFQPENCYRKFYAELMAFADKGNFLNSDNSGISVYLTCVVFTGYRGYTDGSPYVIITKAVRQKPVSSR